MGLKMKAMGKILFFLLIFSGPVFHTMAQNKVYAAARAAQNAQPEDVSAAVAINKDMFIVADDENNVLRVYKVNGPDFPVYQYDLTKFLNIFPEHPEADIEGATMIGNTIYWISSHGRNKDGKMRPNRYRFFATSVKVENGKISIEPTGIPCNTLIHSLVKTMPARMLRLVEATRFDASNMTKQERKILAPKIAGLNIEGLCASPDGKIIYIGFRNPRPYNKVSWRAQAIVVGLNNPKQVIERGYPPVFGDPILWDLGELGIRSMEYSHFYKAYFIIAGRHNGGPGFVLYRWSGEKEQPAVLVRKLSFAQSSFGPEALVSFNNSGKFLLLSDDGSLVIKVSNPGECEEGELGADGTCLNKYLSNQNKKAFRGIWLTP